VAGAAATTRSGDDEPVRLNAYLARAGVASRRGADELIRAGRVRVNGEEAGLATFVSPGDRVELEDGMTAPAQVRRLGPGRLELVLHEGRKRQVRRMCEAVGHPVRTLHRREYAGLTAEGLAPGEWRELTAEEVRELRRYAGL
jgi:16S rRNA U516 pseudouridylate synthase RsuA-like enzyme